MRWNETVTLLAPAEKHQDSAGVWHEGERTQRTIYCNEMILGLMRMAHLRSSDIRLANSNEPVDVGLRNEHMLQVRSLDYGGEDQVIFKGQEYEVVYISGSGDFCTLTIGQRVGNDVLGGEDGD